MTATVQGVDPVKIAERADRNWCKRTADEAAPPEYIRDMASAFRPHLGGTLAVLQGDDVAVKQLRADNERHAATIADLQRLADERARTIDRLQNESKAAAKDGGINEARAERDTARGQLRDLKAENAGLADQLAAAKAELDEQDHDLTSAHDVLDELAAQHKHIYPWPGLSILPLDCECGQPYPRAIEYEDEPEDEPTAETWDDLLGRVRTELAEWPAPVVDEGEEP